MRWLALALVLVGASATWAAEPASKPATIEQRIAAIKPEMVEKIKAALPEKAAVTAEKPRKLLIYTRAVSFVHSSIPHGALALQLMGEKSGAYAAVVSEDAASFEPEALKEIDAIAFISTTGELFDLPKDTKIESLPAERQAVLKRRRDALVDFAKGGRGVVGIHAACDCSYQWGDWQDLIGGLFDGHPWHEKITLKAVDEKSPINAMFSGPFQVTDEIYQFQAYSREKSHILTVMTASEKDPELKKGKRADRDYAISWVKKFGEGRVFYCSLGHREEIYWNPTVLKHYLAGIQFALGDLKADATPSGKLELGNRPK